MNARRSKRVDIVSDTHGTLSPELLSQLKGADLIVCAGDVTSVEDYDRLCCIAPVHAVLGNNDYFFDYGPSVSRLATFEYEGLSFAVAHYREDLAKIDADVKVFGHTHVPVSQRVGETVWVNPGSPTFPRSEVGPSFARALVVPGEVQSVEIVRLSARR